MGARRIVIESIILIALLGAAWCVVPTFTRRPWDLETYVLAARAMQAGLNPYSPASLEMVAGRPVGMLFIYPPVTIPLFYPLAPMSFPLATALWLGIRVVALLFLFQIWRRLLPEVPAFFLALAVAFGFNGSVIWDLRTGNVTVLQDLFLWLGFAWFVQGRHGLSAAGILVGSLFKLLPAAFLGLLLVR